MAFVHLIWCNFWIKKLLFTLKEEPFVRQNASDHGFDSSWIKKLVLTCVRQNAFDHEFANSQPFSFLVNPNIMMHIVHAPNDEGGPTNNNFWTTLTLYICRDCSSDQSNFRSNFVIWSKSFTQTRLPLKWVWGGSKQGAKMDILPFSSRAAAVSFRLSLAKTEPSLLPFCHSPV